MTTGIWCCHTWLDAPVDHVHACAGLASCHLAPCRCVCGALDHCTEWAATMPPTHKTARPPEGEGLHDA